MDLTQYIESGIIESCVLGLASPEDRDMLERMRILYPEVEEEVDAVERRLERVAVDEMIPPPVHVWTRIARRVHWHMPPPPAEEEPPQRPVNDRTYMINVMPRVMTVSIWWRCAFVGLCMLVMCLLATTYYFYNKYHQLEEKVLQLTLPAAKAGQLP